MADGLSSIDHFVVLMLENRSLDHMLGFLYTDGGNVSPSGDAFEGLTGNESCPDGSGNQVGVYRILPSTENAYFMPGADPGEGYAATNAQLYGSSSAPADGAVPAMTGWVTDYVQAIAQNKSDGWYVVPGTTPDMIMGCYDPTTLPVLSALGRGFAVCDHWFGSAPTMTLPNRAFLCAGTSQGHMDDATKTYTCPSIFGLMTQHQVSWKIYGYTSSPLTKLDFPDTSSAPASDYGLFADFQSDAAGGTLPAYAFLEPSWSSTGNSQHPNYDVALGEQMILDTYRALRDGPDWDSTLFILTYDEHGGCYDHVAPPWGAAPPDSTVGEFGFDFTRFGPRVPTILVSPLIPAGSVFRVPASGTPLDHTSILATVEQRWSLPPLTKRDAAAPTVAAALSLGTARTDDPMSGVTAPTPPPTPSEQAAQPSHLQEVQAQLIAREDQRGGRPPAYLRTSQDYQSYIDENG
ncbi:MAG TPA: alkaline phosphatase family protein [Candidatus Dormibacteraeota bacterium]|jgi:phospholipase C|nr:alkaline phosphatase family protein [Candidatus Dormibacteraeota bacterium]